jgi:hypothetical protein
MMQFEKLSRRWGDNIKMNVKETECEVVGSAESGGSRYGPFWCEYSNKPSCSIRDGEFLYQLIDFQLLEDFVPY